MHKDHEKSPSGTYTTNNLTKESTTQSAKLETKFSKVQK